MWKIQLMGGLAVSSPQRQVRRFRSQKAASLLAYLAYRAAPKTPPNSRETLIGMFWPDSELEVGRHNLSNTLSVLRHVLEPPGVPPGTVILADRQSVRLNPGAVTVDVAEFEVDLRAAEAADLAEAERISLLQRAADRYAGPLLPGFYDEWIPGEALRLESLFAQTARRLLPVLLKSQTPGTAIALAQRVVAGDPCDQQATAYLMQALAAMRQPAQAVRAYRQLQRHLRDDLGARPAEPLREYARALRQRSATAVPQLDQCVVNSPFTPARPSSVQAMNPSTAKRGRERLRGAEFLVRTTTRFFGRETEIAQLCAMLTAARTRLVTMTGPGGTGKTRLTLEAVAQLVEGPDSDSPSSAVFVPLADVAEPGRLYDAILRALGGSPSAARSALDQVADLLAREPSPLLILDNFEQLAAEGAPLVSDLLAYTGAKLLVTSRRTLQIQGEQIFPLSSLPTAFAAQTPEELIRVPSVALFVDRAQSTLPDFQLTERNALAVAHLCDHLEGIPLAIELAAARVGVLSPARILDQVSANRLAFLVSRHRDASSRQRTLRAALDWSYRLLPETAKRFMAEASVFRGGWTADAAQTVCETSEEETLELLTLLRDSSLITVQDTDEGVRFAMMETIREYADDELGRLGLSEAVGRRHAAYFVKNVEEIAPRWNGPEGLATARRIVREHANYRAALRWTEANPQDPLNDRQGAAMLHIWIELDWVRLAQWLYGLRPSEAGRDLTNNVRAALEPQALMIYPMAGMMGGILDPDYAVAQMRRIIRMHEARGEAKHAAWVLIYAGCEAQQRNLADAARCLEEALALMRSQGSEVGVACALTGLATVLTLQGQHARAGELLAAARDCLVDWTDTVVFGEVLIADGLTALASGDNARAKVLFEDNLALRRRLGDGPGVGIALLRLGEVALQMSAPSLARQYLEEALGALHESAWDASFFAATVHCRLGAASLGMGQARTAIRLAREALLRFRHMKSRLGARMCLQLLAEVAARREEWNRAARLLGAHENVCALLGLIPYRQQRDPLSRLRERVAEALGESSYAEQAQLGRALAEEDAIALALDENPDTLRPPASASLTA